MELKTLKISKDQNPKVRRFHGTHMDTQYQELKLEQIFKCTQKKIFFLRNKKEKPQKQGNKNTKARKGEERYKSSDRIKYSRRKVGFCGREFRSKKGEPIGRKLKEFL